MHDLDHLAHAAAGVVTGIFDHAIGGRGDLGADTGTQIDAAVQARPFDDRMFAHAEAAGDGGLRQRIAAGYRAEHQAFLECGMAGDRNAFRHWKRRWRVDADNRFELLKVVAKRDEFGGACVDLHGQLRLVRQQLCISFLDLDIAIAEIGQVGVEFFNPSRERVDHDQAAQKYCTDSASGGERRSSHQLGERVMAGAVAVGNRNLIVIAHTKPLFL